MAVGGAVGTLARAGVADAWPHEPSDWAWSTLMTNVSGSALLGVLLVVLARRFPVDRYARPLLGGGLLGGYTTFSALSVDAVQLARLDRAWAAAGYVTANAVGILLGCLLGVVLARRFVAVSTDAGHEGAR